MLKQVHRLGTPDEKTLGQRQLWIAWGLSAVSGGLMAASMPNFDISILGWVALVPLLLAIQYMPDKSAKTLALPFGVIWSIAVHNWYPDVLGPVLDYLLIMVVGSYYGTLIGLGVGLQRRLPAPVSLLALPVLWSALEFIKYIAPIVEDWWFVWLANSQWRFPPGLQILSITGLPGLSFLLMLANVALTALIWRAWREHKIDWTGALALGCVVGIVAWGEMAIPGPPANTFSIAATTDLTRLDPNITKYRQTHSKIPGPYAEMPEMSQALFDVNAELTRRVIDPKVAFVVWPENNFADADDKRFIGQLETLAQQVGAYFVANVVWRRSTGMYNAASWPGPISSPCMRHPMGKWESPSAGIATVCGLRANWREPGHKSC
jgi:apolipoprotein N-acyltransferase